MSRYPHGPFADFYDRKRQDRERDYPSPACSLITSRGSLSFRNPANFAWRKWSIYASYCTSSWHSGRTGQALPNKVSEILVGFTVQLLTEGSLCTRRINLI